jgi:hypothetical protein
MSRFVLVGSISCIILLLTSIVLKGQEVKLLGTFSNNLDGTESITFVGKDSFYYSHSEFEYYSKGRGRCEIIDDRLYLYFENARTKQNAGANKAVIVRNGNADSMALINLQCLDITGSAIEGATIEIISAGRGGTGYLTDSAGFARMEIATGKFPLQLNVTALHVESEIIKIDTAADYSVQIIHRDHKNGFTRFNQGQTLVYEIKQLGEELVVIRPLGGNRKYREYKKKKD